MAGPLTCPCGATPGMYQQDVTTFRRTVLESNPDGSGMAHIVAAGVFCSPQHMAQHILGLPFLTVPLPPLSEEPF